MFGVMRSWIYLLLLTSPLALRAQDNALLQHIDQTAKRHLEARRAALAKIQSVEQAKARQAEVREKILRLIGGLPDYNGPLRAQTTKQIDAGRYRIEMVRFESLPDYWVTANLYLPKTAGKHPAVLYSIGHWNEGKPAGQQICSQLAVKGFVCLAYDPVGQGERQQAYDARTGRSLIGGATEQHFMAGAQAILLGQTVARYFIHDSRRAIDYLVSRPEVDASRIGASGCSGGGTQTTYIAALDERVKVAAPACYMNSFEYLITGPTGDSEQSFPGFLSEGLDQADYVALFAPKPWLITSTEEDFFTPAAAKIVVDQAKAFYRVFGKEDHVQWVVGPGGHGTPLKVRQAIYAWMIEHLNGGQGEAKEVPGLPVYREGELRVTPRGQVEGKDLTDILREQISSLPKNYLSPLALPQNLRLSSFETLGPASAKDVFIVPYADEPSANRARELARHGHKVLLVKLPGYPMAGNQGRLSGDWITHTRAWLAGMSLPLLRAEELLAVVREQLPRHERVVLHAWGVGGIPVLLAARAEPGLAAVWLERTPLSLRQAFASPVHRNLHEAVIPGWLSHEDFPQLMGPKTFWVDPTDWNENILHNAGAPYYFRTFEQPLDEVLAQLWRATAH
jgi:hypothetical protein